MASDEQNRKITFGDTQDQIKGLKIETQE